VCGGAAPACGYGSSDQVSAIARSLAVSPMFCSPTAAHNPGRPLMKWAGATVRPISRPSVTNTGISGNRSVDSGPSGADAATGAEAAARPGK
jgi:hypothetical protein